jgi:putative transposase
VRLVISDQCLGLIEALGNLYPGTAWQPCIVHFYRDVFTVVPKGKVQEVAALLKVILAQEDRTDAQAKAVAVVAKLHAMKLAKAADRLAEGGEETLSYYAFPREHCRRIRTNNPLERIMREIRRRSRAVGAFPDGQSALMLAAARLRHVTSTRWGTRRYLDMEHFKGLEATPLKAAS